MRITRGGLLKSSDAAGAYAPLDPTNWTLGRATFALKNDTLASGGVTNPWRVAQSASSNPDGYSVAIASAGTYNGRVDPLTGIGFQSAAFTSTLQLEADWDCGSTFTATTTSGSNVLTAVGGSLTGLPGASNYPVVGGTVTGTGIPGGTTVTAVNQGASTVTLSANATASASGVAMTSTAPRITENYYQIIDAGRTVPSLRPFYIKYDRTSHQMSEAFIVIGAGKNDQGIAGGSGFSVQYDDGSNPVGVALFNVTTSGTHLYAVAGNTGSVLDLHAANTGNATLSLRSGATGADSAQHKIFANGNGLLSFTVGGAANVLNLYKAGGGGNARVSIGGADNSNALTVISQEAGMPAIVARAFSGITADTFRVEESGGTAHVRVTKATSSIPGSLVVGKAVLANAATDGFLYVPTVAGTPSGTPTTQAGTSAIVYDTTANKLWIYNGSWRSATFA